MNLSELDILKGRYKLFLLQTTSDKLSMYLYDRVKADFECNKDTIIELKDKKDFKQVKEIAFVDSFMSNKWLVKTTAKGISSISSELCKLLSESNAFVVFCTCDNYKEFKGMVDACKKAGVTEIVQFYLTSLRHADMNYLYKQIAGENKLSSKLYQYIQQGYSGNVPAVMDLFEALSHGEKFESRKDIAEVCGIGGNSVESFIFSLLTVPSSSEKGLRVVLKNRLNAGYDLLEIYGYRKFQNFLKASIKKLIDLKMLVISGVVYKKVRELPNGYDEAQLVKYQRFVWRVKEIPLTRLLRLSYHLQRRVWVSDLDLAGFVYAYELDLLAHEVVPFIEHSNAVDEYVIAKEKEEALKAEQEAQQAELDKQERLAYIRKYGIVRGKNMYNAAKGNITEISDAKTAADFFNCYYTSNLNKEM